MFWLCGEVEKINTVSLSHIRSVLLVCLFAMAASLVPVFTIKTSKWEGPRAIQSDTLHLQDNTLVVAAGPFTTPVTFAKDEATLNFMLELSERISPFTVCLVDPIGSAKPLMTIEGAWRNTHGPALYGIGLFCDPTAADAATFSEELLTDMSWDEFLPRLLCELHRTALLAQIAIEHNMFVDVLNHETFFLLFCTDIGFFPEVQRGEAMSVQRMPNMKWSSALEMTVNLLLDATTWMTGRVDLWFERHPESPLDMPKVLLLNHFHLHLRSLADFLILEDADGFADRNAMSIARDDTDIEFCAMMTGLSAFLRRVLDTGHGSPDVLRISELLRRFMPLIQD